MSLLAKLKELADRLLGEDQRAKHLREEELQLAAAALLVHASLIDGRADPVERRKLKSLLQVRFNLGEDEFDRILGEAEAWEQDSVDLYSRKLNRVVILKLIHKDVGDMRAHKRLAFKETLLNGWEVEHVMIGEVVFPTLL